MMFRAVVNWSLFWLSLFCLIYVLAYALGVAPAGAYLDEDRRSFYIAGATFFVSWSVLLGRYV
jgi:hypothetical protein